MMCGAQKKSTFFVLYTVWPQKKNIDFLIFVIVEKLAFSNTSEYIKNVSLDQLTNHVPTMTFAIDLFATSVYSLTYVLETKLVFHLNVF